MSRVTFRGRLNLRKDQLDFEAGTIALAQTKAGRPQVVVINAPARQVLKELLATVPESSPRGAPMLEASVIVCAHNPRPDYLLRVLGALRDQSLGLDEWELLLVDNASDDPLACGNWDLSWHPHARHVRGEELGLAPARLRGMREAKAPDLLVFVDDDNVLDRDYLREAVRIRREWPILGTWGNGKTLPEYEVVSPVHLRQFMYMLALRDVSTPHWSNVIPCAGALPWGAGQCVRAKVAAAYRDYVAKPGIRMTDRRGNALSSGGDVEIGFVSCRMGLGVGIFPDLKLTHLIPKERVSENYLVRLAEGSATSSLLLAYKWEGIRPVSPYSGPVAILRVLKNLLMRKGIHRRMYLASLRSRALAHEIIFNNAS